MARFLIRDFALANSAYIGGVVHFFGVDVDGEADEENLITLYEGLTGSGTLRNPQRLDSEGKNAQPIYADEECIARVSGLAIDDHDTGIISVPGGEAPTWAGANVKFGSNIVNPTYPYTIPWTAAIRNPSGVWTLGAPTKLIVPPGYSSVECIAQVQWANIAADAGVQLTIYKNGSAAYDGVAKALSGKAAYTNPALTAVTAELVAVEGDEFEAVVDSTDAASDLAAAGSWFQMRLKA